MRFFCSAIKAVSTSFRLILGILVVAANIARAEVLPKPALTVTMAATASAAAVEPEGRLIVGGQFESANGEQRRNLARFTAPGVLDPSFNVHGASNGDVTSLVVAGDFLYVGGTFTSIGGKPRNNVARIVRATGAVDEWTLEGHNDPGRVTQMLLVGNDLYIAGVFGTYFYVNFTTVAKIDAVTGKRDQEFAPQFSPMYAPSGDEVDAIALSNGWLYVGGYFTNVGGQYRAGVARLDAKTGAVDVGWDPRAGGVVVSIVANGDDVYVAGLFETIAGASRKYLAKLNAQGKLDDTFAPVFDAPPRSLSIVNGQLLVVGGFTTLNGTTAGGVATLNLVSGVPVLVNSQSWSGTAQSAAQWGSALVVVGSLTDIAGTSYSGVAVLDGSTLLPNVTRRMTVGSPGYIQAMAKLSDGSIFIGGRFTEINQLPRANLALLHPDGALNSAWTTGVNGLITSLLATEDALYASGQFTASGATALSNLARIDLLTRVVDPSRVPQLDSVAYALHAHSGMIYAGGFFQTVNGLSMPRLVRFNATTGAVDLGWNPAPDNIVLSLASSSNGLYVGGRYSTIAGVPRNSLTRFTLPSGVVDGAFDAGITGYAIFDALLLSGDALFAAGNYSNVLLKLRADTGARIDAFVPPPNLYAQSLALTDGMLLTGGGYFGFGGGKPERVVSRLDSITGEPDRSFPDASRGTGALAFASVFAIVPANDRIFFGGFFDAFGGLPRDSVAASRVSIAIGSPSAIPALSDGLLFTLITLVAMCGLVSLWTTHRGQHPVRNDTV